MLPLAHVGITLFFAKHFKPVHLPLLATAVFSVLPDLIDKPLYLLGMAPTSRFIAHTVWFGIALALMCIAFFPRQTRVPLAVAALVGSWFHLALDLNSPLPLFFPLVPFDFTSQAGLSLSFDAATIMFELIGFCALLLVVLESD